MEHNLFKPKNFQEGMEAVVGECNGFSKEERWRVETPLFAKAILQNLTLKRKEAYILDYGCGVGRLAKEILSSPNEINVVGVDASKDMVFQAEKYVGHPKFNAYAPHNISDGIEFDLAYCVYVLQHVPSIEIREILQRIHYFLKEDGIFVYCSSDFRMSIRFDGQGFFDDRFLGVDLRAEVERYFDKVGPLFSDQVLNGNSLLNKMIAGAGGGLAHPAFVYKKKKLVGPLFNATPEPQGTYHKPPFMEAKLVQDSLEVKKTATPTQGMQPFGQCNHSYGKNQLGRCANCDEPISPTEHTVKEYTKLILINRLAPGDILVMTNAIRDLHTAFPGKYQTEVRTPCNAIFDNSPYITRHTYDENDYQKFERELHTGGKDGSTFVIGDILVIDMHYPMIHSSGEAGWHFGYGHRDWLETVLKIKIPQTSIRPEIYLSQSERDWPSPVLADAGKSVPYWVINAGSKSDYTLKQYPYYQEVVDLLKGKVDFVQIGLPSHDHVPLKGVIDMVGKTFDTRKLFRVIHHSLGVLTCVSFPMHIAAAFSKPCVVVAGGREGTRWELYPNQQFLYVNGCLPCAPYDGCWKSKFEDTGKNDHCTNQVEPRLAKCMTMITPTDICRSIERYYQGGVLKQ